MPAEFEPALATPERQAIAAHWHRLANEPPPPPRREIGCMTAIVALVLALADRRCCAGSGSSCILD
jgi:hypothetical protein